MAKACKQHLEKNIFAGLCFISVDVVGYQESLETKKKINTSSLRWQDVFAF